MNSFRISRRNFLALTSVLGIGLLFGCGEAGSLPAQSAASSLPASDNAAVRIVCTMFPQYDLIRALAAGRAELTLLVGQGMEAHGYTLTAQDMIAAAQADLLLCAGGDADAWAVGLLENIDPQATRVLALSDCLEAGESPADEHVWTSPRLCMQLTDALCKTLCELDPDGEETYLANAEKLRAQFAALDEGFSALGERAGNRPFVLGDRQPFSCLAADYGLTFAAAFDGCSTDTEVSAERMTSLTDTIKDTGATTVFYLELSDAGLCRTLSEATGTQTAMLYSGQAMAPDDAGMTLSDMLAYDLAALEKAVAV